MEIWNINDGAEHNANNTQSIFHDYLQSWIQNKAESQWNGRIIKVFESRCVM